MKQNVDDIAQKYPYTEYENTPLWITVDKSLSDLEQNQDIKLSTPKEYVIGYICKSITESIKNDRF